MQGRQYPVDIMYTIEPQSDYIDSALIATLQTHIDYPPGDILVFLTGREDIESLQQVLEERLKLLPDDAMKVNFTSCLKS